MSMDTIGAIVMAAGLGTRMNSELPKVLHPLCGKPLLFHVLDLLIQAKARKVAIVVSHQKKEIIKTVKNHYGLKRKFLFVDQKNPLGTGHAVLSTEKAFKGFESPLIILSGDVPLLTVKTLDALIRHHKKHNVELTIGSSIVDESFPYGRLIRNSDGKLEEIIEATDASQEQLGIREMNMGLYCAEPKALYAALKKIAPHNKKKEYYLTDIVKKVDSKTAFLIKNREEVLGINNRFELQARENYLRETLNKQWMLKGISITDSKATYIGTEVTLGRDVILAPQTHLEGKTSIGAGTTIGVGSIIRNSRVGPHVTIHAYSIIEESHIEKGAQVGPFARLRPGSHVKKKAKVGNFVELKKTTLGEGSKANHLTYLGDAIIGKDVNIGCGVITCNYDGGLQYAGKAKTEIGDHSFIGSDSQLIAPLILKKGAYVASGTTVTENMPQDSLAIARIKQTTKKGYMKKLWAKAKQRHLKKGR